MSSDNPPSLDEVIPDPKSHAEFEIDENVLAALPTKFDNVTASSFGASLWTRTAKIEGTRTDGSTESFFLKVGTGKKGRAMMLAEFESMTAIYKITPSFVPKPLSWGSYVSVPETHFFLCEFRDMEEMMPDKNDVAMKLADLHANGTSSDGRYGFHVTTFNGNLPQDNTWADTWEEFFINGYKHILRLEKESQGPSEEFDAVTTQMIDRVIPRLLRPLESGPEKIRPALQHGDFWCGNVATDRNATTAVVFDSCACYGHREYDLGNWRLRRNKIPPAWIKAYLSNAPASYPEAEFDDRNALYSTRFNIHASILFPESPNFRREAMQEMKRLIAKFPNGVADLN